MTKCLLRRFKDNQRGASVVEFAIILPILLVLVMGIIEFGLIFNGYIVLTGAAREGARVAIVNKDEVEERVNNHVAGSNINIDSISTQYGAKGEETIVSLTGTVPLQTGFFDFLGSSFTLSTEAAMRQQINPTSEELPENE